MKTSRILFSIALTSLVHGSMMAQSTIELKNANGDVMNGTTVEVWGNADSTVMECDLAAVNTAVSSQSFKLKRYEVSVPATTTNYYCWSVCFLPSPSGTHPLWVAADPVSLPPNTLYHGFHSYYVPNDVIGVACFRFIWYVESNPNDSAFVDICFHATPAGISGQVVTLPRFEAFPNPSFNSAITFSCDAARSNEHRSLVISSALGERVLSKAIAPSQHSAVLGEGELPEGLWFASLEVNGSAIATRRVVIISR